MLIPAHGLRHLECLQKSEAMINRLRLTHEATLRAVNASRYAISDSRAALLRLERTQLTRRPGQIAQE